MVGAVAALALGSAPPPPQHLALGGGRALVAELLVCFYGTAFTLRVRSTATVLDARGVEGWRSSGASATAA